MKTLILVLLLAFALSARAQIPVTDVSVFGQSVENVRVAIEQFKQMKKEVERLGDPAAIRPVGAAEVIQSLGLTGLGKTLNDLQGRADGSADVTYSANGLYRPVGDTIITADGPAVPRRVVEYRKFDAVTKAKNVLEEVLRDTETRRESIRRQIAQTTSRLQVAETVAEVHKLQAVLTALGTDLAAIDRERDAAMQRVLTQHIENLTDAARQEQALREERAVDFHAASRNLSRFLTPQTSPVRIPDPRKPQP